MHLYDVSIISSFGCGIFFALSIDCTHPTSKEPPDTYSIHMLLSMQLARTFAVSVSRISVMVTYLYTLNMNKRIYCELMIFRGLCVRKDTSKYGRYESCVNNIINNIIKQITFSQFCHLLCRLSLFVHTIFLVCDKILVAKLLSVLAAPVNPL